MRENGDAPEDAGASRRVRSRSALGSRVYRLFPGAVVFQHYERSWLRPDLIAGLTVGAMLIPQSMAYAELAGLAPQFGFYAVVGALVVYALVGTSRHLGVGPEPGTAILAASAVSSLAAGDARRYMALMSLLALVVGCICVAAAVVRLGFLASMLSKSVLVGYITGVGLTLLSSQIASFTGVPITSDRFFTRFAELVSELGEIDAPTVTMAICTLAIILVLRHLAPQVPGALVGVVLATIVAAVFALDHHGIAVVGTIPSGLPTPGLPDVSMSDVRDLLPFAAGLALVGYTDNVLTARSIAAGRRYRIDANQELVALGFTNLSAAFSHGFPVSSSASRTAVAASLGSKTQAVSLVAAAFVVVTLLALRPVLGEIPRAALAAVIVSAALSIIDVTGYRNLWRVSREEFALAAIAALAVVVFDILTGVFVAVALSIIVALYRIARPHDAILGDQPGLEGWVEVEAHPEAATEPGLVVYRFDAPLFFVNADHFRERVEQALQDSPGQESWLVLDFEGIGALDATALDMLGELAEHVGVLGIEIVAIARANHDVLARLGRAGLLEPTGPLRVFATINSAVRAYRDR